MTVVSIPSLAGFKKITTPTNSPVLILILILPLSSTLPPTGDFDKRANEVVKYDQELNVNEKSTSNEMVGGDAVSWRHQQQQQRYLGVLLGSVLVTVVAVFRLRWLY